jgi:hypothetical protein
MAGMDKNPGQASKALQPLRVPCGRGYPTPVCYDSVASRFKAEPVFLVNPLRTIAQGPHPTPCPNVRSLDLDPRHRFQLPAPVHHLLMVLKTTATVGEVQK